MTQRFSASPPSLSLVIPTYGRTWQLSRLLESLDAQTFRDFEVIVADQNPSGVLDGWLPQNHYGFDLLHINRPNDRGISTARNVGWRTARAPYVTFPDDDSWFPVDYLDRAMQLLESKGCDILTGRSVDMDGRTINGRFAKRACSLTRAGIWITQIEWATFFRRSLLDELGGYDETLGVGCPTPWQAAEGPDLVLRALKAGWKGCYDPDLTGYHEEYETNPPSAAMTVKARAYARGMGYVLRKNGASVLTIAYWASRPLFQLLVSLCLGRLLRSRHFLLVSIGRLEGWTRRLLRVPWRLPDFTGRDELAESSLMPLTPENASAPILAPSAVERR